MILTTTPNEVVKPTHSSRMPVILDDGDYDEWLTGSQDEVARLLKPFAAGRMHIVMEGGKEDAVVLQSGSRDKFVLIAVVAENCCRP